MATTNGLSTFGKLTVFGVISVFVLFVFTAVGSCVNARDHRARAEAAKATQAEQAERAEQTKRESQAQARLEALKLQEARTASLGAFKVQLVKAGAWGKVVSDADFDPNGGSTLLVVATYELMSQPRMIQAEFAQQFLRLWQENGGKTLRIISPSGRTIARTGWDGSMNLED